MKCDNYGCTTSATHQCTCRRCASEPEDDERYSACKDHLGSVGRDHERVRERCVDWRVL